MLWGNQPWKRSWFYSVHHHTPPCHITSVHINIITHTHHDLTMWSKATSSQVPTFSSLCRLIDHCWHTGNWAGIDKCMRWGLRGLDTVEKLRANTTWHHIRSNGSLKVRFLSIFIGGRLFKPDLVLKCCSLLFYLLWLFHWNFKMSHILFTLLRLHALYFYKGFLAVSFKFRNHVTTRKCIVHQLTILAQTFTFPFKKVILSVITGKSLSVCISQI